ncbi:MFS domain-containing protein [Mycena kentingensis (nom. inval.)]|nr:MFS domain-containing protein [Mycena kentingensis (nom. inval.)]
MSGPSRPPSRTPTEHSVELCKARWRQPSAWWLVFLAPFSLFVQTATAGVSLELYTNLVCEHLSAAQAVPFSLGDCPRDAVDAEVTKLTTATATITGLLSFVTAAWWGSFSDRHGRTRMVGIASIGHALSLAITILVAQASHHLPGGYWFAVLAPIVTGVLGGMTSETTALHAYVADIAAPADRSRIFSLVMGAILLGVGVGPVIGSLVLRLTQNVLFVFYFAAALRLFHLLIVWTVFPESLTTEQMLGSMARHREALGNGGVLRGLIALVKPLEIFWPSRHPDRPRREWNLLLLATVEGLMNLVGGSVLSQLLYAIHVFGWGGEYLGYCISSIGFTRAVFLVGILPVVIKYGKAEKQPAASDEAQPLLSNETGPAHTRPRASKFDLSLARVSIAVSALTFALLPFAQTTVVFILFLSLGSFASGMSPALNSVALELYTHQVGVDGAAESGKLFGALGVVQALLGSTIGPSFYGAIYATTLKTAPKTLFFVALGNAALALVVLMFVRLPKKHVFVAPQV